MSLFSVFYFMLYSVFSRQYPVLLEQSCNLSSSVYIDTLCCRNFRQTWHGHDVTGQGYDEACTCGDFQVTYGNFESGRCAEFGLTANAQKQAKQLEALGFGNCPI